MIDEPLALLAEAFGQEPEPRVEYAGSAKADTSPEQDASDRILPIGPVAVAPIAIQVH